MGLVDHALDPVGSRQSETSLKSPLDHRSACSAPGATSMIAVLAAAVAPLVPTRPLSASTTVAPLSIASIAAQAPAGPPPRTRTSAAKSKLQSSARPSRGRPSV